MADIEKHMTIAAAPEAVRAAVLDAGTVTEWQGSLSEYEQTSPDPPRLGTTSRGVSELVGMRLEWTAEIAEWTDESFMWKSVEGDPPWEIRWTFAAAGGATDVRFEQSSSSLNGMKGAIARSIVGGQVEKDLEALRGRLES
ncbi:MAG: SRPBCC family protein [Miltoncostaeaceae bacterium]